MPETLRLRDVDLEWREVEGEVVGLDLRSSNYLAVNLSGAKLWQALATGATRDQLVEILVAEFGIAPDQATSEANAFVASLTEQDLLLEE